MDYHLGSERQMTRTPVSFKLTDTERGLLDSIADEIGGGRPEALRYAIIAARKQLGLYATAAEAFIDGLRASMDEDATIVIALDDTFTPRATVDGIPRSDIYIPSEGLNLGPDEQFLKLYLADVTSEVRIFLGLMPLRTGVPLMIAAEDLHPNMAPRPIAYFVHG
jgi:hypothetical protein